MQIALEKLQSDRPPAEPCSCCRTKNTDNTDHLNQKGEACHQLGLRYLTKCARLIPIIHYRLQSRNVIMDTSPLGEEGWGWKLQKPITGD
jgi:hypothetical protein